MSSKTIRAILASVLQMAAWTAFVGVVVCAEAQPGARAWAQRTSWGDLDLQGEWTSEGEFGVPLERPAEFGTRAHLTDEEYAKRLADVRARDERDLRRGRRARRQGRRAERADSALARIRNGLAAHVARDRSAERATAVAHCKRCGRCPWNGAAACNAANRATPTRITGSACAASCTAAAFRTQCFRPSTTRTSNRAGPGLVAITYELIHDTRVIPIDCRREQACAGLPAFGLHGRRARPLGRRDARRRDDESQGGHAGRFFRFRLIERFTRVSQDSSTIRSPSSIRARGRRPGPPRST